MSLWYNTSSSPAKAKGKFVSRPRMGVQRTAGTSYRDWTYEFVSHQTGTSVRRTCYHVSIRDPLGISAEYLRDFPSLEQAREAAEHWIDCAIERREHAKRHSLGTIPKLPNR